MLRIAHTINSLASRDGGTARVVPQLADALAALGCHVSVVFTADGEPETTMLPRQARAVVVARRPWAWLAPGRGGFAQQVAGAIGPDGPRLVHDHGLWGRTNYLAARTAARARVPLVISPHGMLKPWAMAHRRMRKRIALSLYQRRVLESASMFVVSADAECESVRQAGLRQPVAVTPSGVDLPSRVANRTQRRPPHTALFLGRIHPIKGLLPLLDAWRRIAPPDWRLVIAGPDEGGHLAEVRSHVARHGLGTAVHFPGQADGELKQRLFEDADLFVLPTWSENFGVVVAEALSQALPVLTTTGAPWSALPRSGAGWWVEPGVDGLATGLQSAFATTAAQRAAMGAAGFALARREYSWQAAAERTRDAYAWMLDPGERRPGHVHLA